MSKENTPSIRLARPEDHAAWLGLWQGYQQFYKANIDDSVTAETWRRLLDASEPMQCALALNASGVPVGFVHWIFHRSTWTTGNYAYLQDLFVATDVRGGGHGRQLIEHVYADAKTAGCSRVYWLTHETNTDAMKLYDRIAERSGFVQYRHAVT
ncbi:GNAT family N-acetyltransferase [Hydrogenophaga sp.]|uniref:GNAT family N-acetyltransferase n=1 Tax=Hydrogenophaga sp. TaxID=1904254 RepID=UPI00271D80E5|nr:GNAT family N-acetyltransferase [Hydrogenophaga sp.]MDO9435876.1 GNAT family N-acetyltransferase [Hydrogenophaga sp.]